MIKSTFKSITLLSISLFTLNLHAAEHERLSFSYLGLGADSLNYKETTYLPDNTLDLSLRGAKVESDYSGVSFSQRAGGYISINKEWGFYINNSSTVGSVSKKEKWTINGIERQSNSMTLSRADTNILITKNITDKHHFLFGTTYNRLDYSRFNISVDGNELPNNPTISEEAVEFSAEIGYEFNTFFLKSSPENIRYQAQLLVSMPMYTHVRNTAVDGDTPFTDSFSGYSLRASASVGYQINQNFMIAATIEANYQDRQKETRETDQKETLILPDRVFNYIQPSINLYWAF